MVDRAVVERAQRGDREAYELLVRSSVDRLFAVACRIIGDADRADDAVQQALVSMWRDLPSLRDPDRFDGWAYRLVVRSCLSDLRRTRRARVRSLSPDEVIAAADGHRDTEIRDQLSRALRELTPEHRTVLVLHHYVGLPTAEIAEIVGVPLGTATSRIHHATRAMRAAIEADDRTPAMGGQLA